MIWQALTLGLGYNATLVTLGATLLGIAAGVTGTFLFLRKRALVSDAISHATLPGVGLAFIVMVLLGGDGRSLPGLMIGSAISAGAGLLCISWITSRTRLSEDAAIGAVLSVFFGVGIVLLTVIQGMTSGRQAGLESFLLGSTAGMLWADAVTIAIGGALVLAGVIALRRPLSILAFDPGYAAAAGLNVARLDLAIMGLVMGITVVGLKIVGLILIVALLIIPPVAARFWSEKVSGVLWISGLIGGLGGYIGAALSASAPALPTGPVIVLALFAMFAVSILLAPARGVLAAVIRHLRFQRQIHLRQGLLALAQGQPIYEKMTLRLLKRAGFALADGVATTTGKARAAKALRDEHRWQMARSREDFALAASHYDGLTEIETVLTTDQISELDRLLGAPRGVPS